MIRYKTGKMVNIIGGFFRNPNVSWTHFVKSKDCIFAQFNKYGKAYLCNRIFDNGPPSRFYFDSLQYYRDNQKTTHRCILKTKLAKELLNAKPHKVYNTFTIDVI